MAPNQLLSPSSSPHRAHTVAHTHTHTLACQNLVGTPSYPDASLFREQQYHIDHIVAWQQLSSTYLCALDWCQHCHRRSHGLRIFPWPGNGYAHWEGASNTICDHHPSRNRSADREGYKYRHGRLLQGEVVMAPGQPQAHAVPLGVDCAGLSCKPEPERSTRRWKDRPQLLVFAFSVVNFSNSGASGPGV